MAATTCPPNHPSILICRLLCVLVLVFAALPVNARIFVDSDKAEPFSIPSFDSLEFVTPFFNYTNALLVEVAPPSNTSIDSGCIFEPPPARSNHAQGTYNSTVAYLVWNTAKVTNCRSYYEAVLGVSKLWAPLLNQLGYPPITAVILASSSNAVGPPSGPFAIPYKLTSLLVPDGLPVIDTAIIGREDGARILPLLESGGDIKVDVVQEPGDWNRVYLSAWYIGFTWSMFVVNAGVVMIALSHLVISIRSGLFLVDLRGSVFVLALISALLYMFTLPLRYLSWPRYIAAEMSSYFYTMSFYLLVMLWGDILSRTQQMREQLSPYRPLRIVVFSSLVVLAFNKILAIVMSFATKTDTMERVELIAAYIRMSTDIIIACLMAWYGWRFLRRRQLDLVSPGTRSMLGRLLIISAVGSVSFIMEATGGIIRAEKAYMAQVPLVVAIMASTHIAATARAAVLLLVLGLRMPSRRSQEQGAGVLTEFGNMSNESAKGRIRNWTMSEASRSSLDGWLGALLPWRSSTSEKSTVHASPTIVGSTSNSSQRMSESVDAPGMSRAQGSIGSLVGMPASVVAETLPSASGAQGADLGSDGSHLPSSYPVPGLGPAAQTDDGEEYSSDEYEAPVEVIVVNVRETTQ